ncbi:hypothetical protein PpBr36_02450 [Pyricularia pennisetigena]|uniref:hypothetical protein n=1 Tax=Pyricularia pennisetigena TaxID=1578925 RepID=UPI00114ED63E|nr:hypothetical protein PpBr36_02450 [Pyricularia pennisetigena]TLS31312.1 hypothetical protein PpBr36_02450 [Pyricularia pennisetigena]
MHLPTFFTTAVTLLTLTPNYVVAVGDQCIISLVPDGESFSREVQRGNPNSHKDFTWGRYSFSVLVKNGCAGEKVSGTIPPGHFVTVAHSGAMIPTNVLRDGDPSPPSAVYPPPAPHPDGRGMRHSLQSQSRVRWR